MPCCRVKTELGEEDEEDNRLYSKIVFKIAIKAHFQLPNASGHEFKPKAFKENRFEPVHFLK